MAKSGITRRIDELGRIVIPKEMRINLGIREGEPLEIFLENNNLIIKKFSQVENIKDVTYRICSIISDVCQIDLMITDREKVIVASKNLSSLINKKINHEMQLLIDNRENYISKNKDDILSMSKYFIMLPIVTQSDSSGLVIVVSDNFDEMNIIIAKIVQKLLVDSLDVA